MDTLLGIVIGVGLAAACGFRVFVPLLIMSVAAQTGQLELAEGFEWVGSGPAVAVFSVATLVEVLAYYIPGVDHMLDTVATPAAVVAGTVATASMVGDLSPLLSWSLAIVAGGGMAGAVQVSTVKLRAISGVSTAGLANPVVSTGELAGAAAIPLAAILVPLLAVVLIVVFFVVVIRKQMRRRRQAELNAAAGGLRD
jgi:uncharacterized membrane protein